MIHPRQSVYVISAKDGPIKIGVAVKPRERLRVLSAFVWVPLSLEFSCEHEWLMSTYIERESHRQLKEYRLRGEWFNVSIEAAISTIKAVIETGAPVKRRKSRPLQGAGAPPKSFKRLIRQHYFVGDGYYYAPLGKNGRSSLKNELPEVLAVYPKYNLSSSLSTSEKVRRGEMEPGPRVVRRLGFQKILRYNFKPL